MNTIHPRRYPPPLAIAFACAIASWATMPQPSAASGMESPANVRGRVIGPSRNALQVKGRDGNTLDVALAKGWQVARIAAASMADIQPGSFVGIASLSKADVGSGALEVLISPPAMTLSRVRSYLFRP